MPPRAFRLALALFVIAFVVALTPLAYADPPDPTWQHAYFDDDDFDEIVGYITSATGLAEAPVARCLRPMAILVVLRCSPSEAPTPFVPLLPSDPRAPPPA